MNTETGKEQRYEKVIQITPKCSSCDYSRIDAGFTFRGLVCRKGKQSNGFGTVHENFSCELFNGSELIQIERNRGFIVEN